MIRFALFVAAALACHAAFARAADQTLLQGEAGGGYDSNPLFIDGGDEAAFADAMVLAAWGRLEQTYAFAAAGQIKLRDYVDSAIASDENYRLAFVFANAGNADFAARSISLVNYTASDDLRAFDAVQRVRLRKTSGAFQPFLDSDLRFSELEETNGFFFETLRFTRGSAAPGLAALFGSFEVGASIEFSSTAYEDLDVLGRSRDNDRVQPGVYLRYAKDNVAVYAAAARLYGWWRDETFEDVDRTLLQFSASYARGDLTFQLGASQAAQDTNFIFSPITIATLLEARLNWRVMEGAAVDFWVRDLTIDYEGFDIEATARIYGITALRSLNSNFTLALEVSQADGNQEGGAETERTLVLLSLRAALQSEGAAIPLLNASDLTAASRRRARQN